MRNAELKWRIARRTTRMQQLRIPHSTFRIWLSICQNETQGFELLRHVHRLDRDVSRHRELHRGEVEDRLHPRLHESVDDVLGRVRGDDDDGDVGGFLLEIGLEVPDVADDETVPARADLLRVAVVDGADVKAALAKAGILRQRAADATRPNHHHTVRTLEAQDFAESDSERGDRVAETAFAEGAEEGKVFPDLRGGGAAAAGGLGGGDGFVALGLRLLQGAQVQRHAPYRALGDLPHM